MKQLRWLYLTLFWMTYWLAVAGATVYVLPTFLNADQFHNSWITTVYFALFAIASAVFFDVKASLPHLTNVPRQVAIIIGMAVGFILVTSFIDFYFPLNDRARTIILDSQLYYPLFSMQTIIPKTFDIIFQQITIFGFIKYLIHQNYDKNKVVRVVWLAFACVHLPLMVKPGIYWITLVLPSLFAGLLFSKLILNFRYGLTYSFALHFFFYIITGTILRFYHAP